MNNLLATKSYQRNEIKIDTLSPDGEERGVEQLFIPVVFEKQCKSVLSSLLQEIARVQRCFYSFVRTINMWYDVKKQETSKKWMQRHSTFNKKQRFILSETLTTINKWAVSFAQKSAINIISKHTTGKRSYSNDTSFSFLIPKGAKYFLSICEAERKECKKLQTV